MDITIKDKEYELDLGIGFALALDKKYKFKQNVVADVDVEFGMGIATLMIKLESSSIEGILEFFDLGLKNVKTASYSKRDLEKGIEAKAVELGGFGKLSSACIEALKEVGLYNHLFENMGELQDEIQKYLEENEK